MISAPLAPNGDRGAYRTFLFRSLGDPFPAVRRGRRQRSPLGFGHGAFGRLYVPRQFER